MRGDKRVIDHLNRYLTTELTGFHQYLQNARILANWGLSKLAEREGQYAAEEKDHAQRLADRILFLEGKANFQAIDEIQTGKNVKDILAGDLSLVRTAMALLRDAAAYCETVHDFVSRDLFREMLDDEEHHAHWLEIQLQLIEKMGMDNYVQSQSFQM